MTPHLVDTPVLETERLILRAPRLGDFPAFAAHCASDRALFATGRLSRREAWLEFAAACGSWALHGFGAWSVEDRGSGTYLGEILIQHPAHFPEPEIGWTLMEAAQGKGYATEAASAALAWAWGRGFETLVSYITPGNVRSIALARRLGAEPDPDASVPEGETQAETEVFRHPQPGACI